MSDTQLRVGIGKIDDFKPSPWYVTIYNRALTADRAQAWFKTHAEAIAYASRMLPIWKRGYSK